MSEKFFIKHDNIALLVNTMAGRLSEWSGCLSEIMMNFDDFSSSEGFTGNSANAAREYCATYYGCNGASSLPILLSESAVAISEALLLYEKTFLDFDTVEKFSISEEEIDYIIQDAGVEAINDFETIHENAINIINSISDIVELPKPDDTYYIQDSEDIVSQLEEVKEDIYELEAAELVKIEELNEQIDSLLALVESYSNKTKRATSFVSSDEIITSELETAIEEYAKSCQRRQLNAANLEAAKAQHAATMERIQKEFEEQRKKQGEQKIWHGIFAATVGTLCIVCTAGAASPVVIGAGLTFGAGSLLYGDSYIQEGEEDIYYASIGDVSTPASNYIRDSSVFKGNQELYDLWGSINVSGAMSMIPVGLKGSGVLRSSVNMTSSSLATETRFVVYDTIASESASFGMGEYCDYKGIDGTDKLMLQSAASFVTSLGMVKASDISQGTKQVTKFSYDDLPGEETIFRLDDVNLEKLDTIDSKPIGYYEKPSIKNKEMTLSGRKLTEEELEYNNFFRGDIYKSENAFDSYAVTSNKNLYVEGNCGMTCSLNENLDGHIMGNSLYAGENKEFMMNELSSIRKRATEVTSDTVMQKVIDPKTCDRIISNNENVVYGCITKAEDASPYIYNVQSAYENLRLDYEGTVFKQAVENDDNMIVMRFITKDSITNDNIPKLVGGSKPPCTTTGLVGSQKYLIPEYSVSGCKMKGAAMYSVDKKGNEFMMAYFDGDNWIGE